MILQKQEVIYSKKFKSNVINNLYNEYYEYVLTLCLKEGTIDWRMKHIRKFLFMLDNENFKIENLKIHDIYDYLSSIENLSARTREHRAICIRFFLNFLYNRKYIVFNGNTVLPKIICNKNEKLISYYSINEINTLIESIDVKSKNGKRDLAIMLTFAYLGIRSKDLINLTFENIDWKENKISFVSSKNNYPLVFPIPEKLRYAIIDYLANERPITNLNSIFINNGKPLNDSTVYNIVNKYFKKANINIKNRRHGSHSLRHSLATSMLQHGISIYKISSILGHTNVEDTKIYTHVDFLKLKKISLEVPTWKI